MSNPITTVTLGLSKGNFVTYVVPGETKSLFHQLTNQFPEQFPTVDKKAERFLTAVCEFVKDGDSCSQRDAKGDSLVYLSQIEGLREWWAKHKQSEREKKVDKIQSILRSFYGIKNFDQDASKSILSALEE